MSLFQEENISPIENKKSIGFLNAGARVIPLSPAHFFQQRTVSEHRVYLIPAMISSISVVNDFGRSIG